MSITTTPDFEPDFNSKSSYMDEHGFIQVVYPKNSPILAENLNEMQQIASSKISLLSSALVTDGVIPFELAPEHNTSPENGSWYDDSWYNTKKSGDNAVVTFVKPFWCVCEGQIFSCNLQNINATFVPSVINNGVTANLYLKVVFGREITSIDTVYRKGYAVADESADATIDNYLSGEFADFSGKELSRRIVNYIERFSWNTESSAAEINTPGTGGIVKYVLLGHVTLNFVDGIINYSFSPNYSSIKIPYKYSITKIESLREYIKSVDDKLDNVNEEIKKLSDSADEQLFNNFVAISVTFATNTDGTEIVTSVNRAGDVKKTNISSDRNTITEFYYLAGNNDTVYRTKTTKVGSNGNITITYK